jgi:predicted DNA-binding protein (UPF0251 family)/predicted Fe-Mo cluster-binding NifX family protein
MPRPHKWRCLECRPGTKVFGPVGVPAGRLDKVILSFDELEALRLLHLEGATQDEAGARLGVSRSTVSRMAQRAHRTVTEALVEGKAVCIEGGPVTVVMVSSTPFDPEPGGTAPAPHEVGRALKDVSNADVVSRTHKGEKMIIAVPYLDGDVNAHFGSTRAFLLAETSDGRLERSSIFEVQGMQHNHAGIADFLKEQGVEVILAGGMGGPMQSALKSAGFELYCGVGGPALPAVEAYLAGELEQSDATCGHPHGECN